MAIRKRLPDSLSRQQWDELVSIAALDPDRIARFLSGAPAGDEIPIDHRTVRPYSPDELAALYGIDLNIYECTYYHPNVWSVGAKYKDADGTVRILKEPLYQSKAVFKRKTSSKFDVFIEQLREVREYQHVTPIQSDGHQKAIAVELCLFDVHLGKEAMEGDWSLDKCKDVWWESVYALLEGIPIHNVERFCLPTGNDLLHVDGTKGLTTNGTPVGNGNTWFRNMLFGKDLVAETIQYLSQYAPVVVPIVPGNHDLHSVMALGAMIEERFRGREDVKILSSTAPRLYWRYGCNLIGYCHGDVVKAANIAQMMPVEQPMDYAATTYRAFHLGHIHTRKRFGFQPEVAEAYGVDVCYVPSLSPTDAWHSAQGYIGNQRRSQAFIYHAEDGLLSERFYTLKK